MRVFISYTHDSTEHKNRVWELCERLLKDGLDCRIDQHEFSPPEGWPRWCRDQVKEARFVLVVCTETYKRRYEGTEEARKGLGAKWEGFIITQELYEAEGRNSKFIPLVFSAQDTKYIPIELRAATRYVLDGEDDYENLLRHLTDQPARVKSEVAQRIRSMPPIQRRQTFSGPLWNVPVNRNPFFTGRESALGAVEEELKSSGLVALKGIGGAGKTEAAVEYAYRRRGEYSAILWANAFSRETLISDFVALAKLVDLPLKDEPDQMLALDAVKQWLATNGGWLLVLDNLDSLAMLQDFVPPVSGGHILITTQAQATGAVRAVPIAEMLPDDGALLLLRRAKKTKADDSLGTASEPDRTAANQISMELGGLPLALDQAGAYIEETGCRLEDYLKLYRNRNGDLLRRRGPASPNHPNSVATTFALSFEKVERENKEAADLLRLFAFLYADEIPEEILESGASELGPILGPVARDHLRLNAAFAEALKYSLVKRDPDAMTLQIHRLVQVVLKNEMDESAKKLWAERVVRITYLAFPDWEGVHNWGKYKRWLPQAFACADLAAEQKLRSGELAWVINQAASYLLERGIYRQAGPLCRMAVRMWEEVYGPDHPDLATGLSNLAALYNVTGEYTKAEPLYKRALAIKQGALGPDHPDVASGLKSIASLYRQQGKYAEAEPLFQQALTIQEKALGPGHPDVGASLNGLAVLLSDQGKYAEAEPLYQRALAIRETALGRSHPDVAMTLSNMAVVFGIQGKSTEAESLLKRALAISEAAKGANHPDVATCLSNLAKLYMEQGYHSKAEPYLQRALDIRTNSLGPGHPAVATVLEHYSVLLRGQKRIAAAREMEARARAIREAHAKRNQLGWTP